MAQAYHLERIQLIPQSLLEVFAFFADAGNLETLTPEFLHFRILTPLPIYMDTGTLIDYWLRLFGVPFSWRTQIQIFKPQRRFIDIQVAGPYRFWHHLHEFAVIADGTSMRDVVDYALPFGPLSTVAHALLVRRMLDRIFDYRRDCIAEIFPVRTQKTRNRPDQESSSTNSQ